MLPSVGIPATHQTSSRILIRLMSRSDNLGFRTKTPKPCTPCATTPPMTTPIRGLVFYYGFTHQISRHTTSEHIMPSHFFYNKYMKREARVSVFALMLARDWSRQVRQHPPHLRKHGREIDRAGTHVGAHVGRPVVHVPWAHADHERVLFRPFPKPPQLVE